MVDAAELNYRLLRVPSCLLPSHFCLLPFSGARASRVVAVAAFGRGEHDRGRHRSERFGSICARDILPRMRKNPFMPKSRLLAFVVKELRKVLPPMVFFAVGFNLIVLNCLRVKSTKSAGRTLFG
jgi:hypothetical protein